LRYAWWYVAIKRAGKLDLENTDQLVEKYQTTGSGNFKFEHSLGFKRKKHIAFNIYNNFGTRKANLKSSKFNREKRTFLSGV